jgi:hypothetical protein
LKEKGQAQMKLHPLKKVPFWVAVILAAASLLVYAGHLVAQFILHVNILHLQLIAFMLVSTAFLVLFLGMTLPGQLFARKAEPPRDLDQSPLPKKKEPAASHLVESEKKAVTPLVGTKKAAVSASVETEEPTTARMDEVSQAKQRPSAGKLKYYLVVAILCVLYLGLGFSPWAPFQTPFALFVGLPAGFWLIYELSQDEKPGG